MKFQLMIASGLLWATTAMAYDVSVRTVVANPGQRVAMPIQIDTVKGLSHLGVRISYDPRVLVLTKAEEGSLAETLSEDYVVVGDEKSGFVSVSLFGTSNVQADKGGTISTLIFAVRDGTQGQYSDVTISNVKLGEESGVRDISVDNPVKVQSGMVRVVAKGTAVDRLEFAQVINADAVLGSLSLRSGDSVQASGEQTPIVVSGEVVPEGGVITVREPVNGWSSGRYAILSTTTSGLAFALDGATGEMSFETKDGLTTYYASVAIAGELPVVCEDEPLSSAAANQIRENARLAFEGKTDAESVRCREKFGLAKRIAVEGIGEARGSVALIADMGISPAFGDVDETGTLRLSYAMPSLRITSFDAQTGVVRFRVTPGDGNQIVSEIATGYVHVYGTDSLGEKMKYISHIGFDLTPYLKSDTRGEGLLQVELGTYTFLKIKVEGSPKSEGQLEQ